MAEFKKKATDKMEGQVEHLRHEFTGLRTGRASVALLDQVKVDYYGTPTPLKQVATLATPESRLITVHRSSETIMKDIEKAILASGLGLTPTSDGKLIRLPIPPLTEERRKILVKVAKRLTEEVRVHIQNIGATSWRTLRRAKGLDARGGRCQKGA